MQASGDRILGLGRGRWDSKSRKLGLGSKGAPGRPASMEAHFRESSCGDFPKIMCTIFGGPNNMEYSVLGSILGSPDFGKLHCVPFADCSL